MLKFNVNSTQVDLNYHLPNPVRLLVYAYEVTAWNMPPPEQTSTALAALGAGDRDGTVDCG